MRWEHIAKVLPVPDGEDMIVINSFDEAETFKTQNNLSSVVPSASSLITTSLIQERHLAAGANFNVCTRLQMMGEDNLRIMKSVLDNDYWSSRKALVEKKKNLTDIHHQRCGYMMYMIQICCIHYCSILSGIVNTTCV